MSSNPTRLGLLAIVACLCLTVACGDAEGQSGNDQNRSNQNQSNQNDQNNQNQQNGEENQNGEEPFADPADCSEVLDTAATFDVPVPEGAQAAHTPRLRRVEEQLWTSFNATFQQGEGEEAEETTRLYLVRLVCSGKPIEEPIRVDDGDGVVASPGRIATDGEVAYVTWGEEVEEGPRVRARAFDADGTPRTDAPFDVQIHPSEGDPVADLVTPDIAVTSSGDAAVAAAHPIGFSESYAVVQRFDDAGAPVDDGFFIDDGAENPQSAPAIAIRDDQNLAYAFIEQTGFGVGDVKIGTIASGGTSSDEGPTATEPDIGTGEGNDSTSVRLSKNAAAGNTWMTYPVGSQGENTVTVRSALVIGVREGESSRITDSTSFRPTVTGSETGGAVAWVSSGEQGTVVHFQRFVGGGTDVSSTGPIIDQHPEGDAAGYAPDISWLTGDVYATVWVDPGQGEEAPTETVEGRIVDFEAEE